VQVDDRNRLEEELQDLCRRGEVNQAVEQALRGYGPEIRRLMVGVLQNEDRAQDAFSLFSEFLLKGLPGFRWESSFRTWAQRMARNACLYPFTGCLKGGQPEARRGRGAYPISRARRILPTE
jgi:RNA polymerase sigma-70 factor, ECF subfamily